MRLDSVEIVGFKSFCDRQELSFTGGVTGIVGPNGCGKSNISDAINWVLGEQSVKSLRGTSMEDVIFNGSSSRQPLQMAEVNLKVSGLNGNSPDGAPDCVVSRRLYRNGESEYLMNGKLCRLRDIHELFMDTGLGSKAYSIIEQGKIGQILSSKPADRRAIIEEAAGITKYRARRRQTQLKLEAAQQNLLRVSDVLGEIRRQIGSIERQARKAARFKRLRETSRVLELSIASDERHELVLAIDRARQRHRELADQVTVLVTRLSERELAMEEKRIELAECERALAQGSEALLALRGELVAEALVLARLLIPLLLGVAAGGEEKWKSASHQDAAAAPAQAVLLHCFAVRRWCPLRRRHKGRVGAGFTASTSCNFATFQAPHHARRQALNG